MQKKKRFIKSFNIYNYLELIGLDAFSSFLKKAHGAYTFFWRRGRSWTVGMIFTSGITVKSGLQKKNLQWRSKDITSSPCFVINSGVNKPQVWAPAIYLEIAIH